MRFPLRRLAGACLVLLVALLPALLAGSGVDRPPAPGEWQRLVDASAPVPPSLVSSGFLLAQVPELRGAADALPAPGAAAAPGVLAEARLAQVWGLFAVSLLTYMALLLAGGRARALLGCALLAILPPVWAEGHVLRSETPAVMFGLLALVLLLGIPTLQNAHSRPRSATATLLAIGITAATSFGFALAALPQAGILLLVPGLAMVFVAVQLVVRLLAVLRRRLWVVVPLRAATARLWPWVFASLAALFVAVLILDAAVRDTAAVRSAPSAVGLLPAAAWLRWPLAAIGVVGAARLAVRGALGLLRRGRPSPELLLFLFCVVLLGQHLLRAPGEDALLAVVPMAVVLGEGIVYAAVRVGARLQRAG